MYNLEKIVNFSQDLTLLYVEDNEHAREMTEIVLENFFPNIIVAVDGEDGFEKFKQNDIDLIITDINMPKLNGLDMIDKIRHLNSDVSILVLSAYNESGFFIDSIKLGVDGYLLKPIDMDQFLGMLEKIVHKLELVKAAQVNLHFLKEYEEVTNESSIVSKTDINGFITYVNDKFCNISGYSKDELVGNKHNMIRGQNTPDEVFERLWDTIKNKKQVFKAILQNKTKNGKNYYIDATIKPILDSDGKIVEFIALEKDITDIMNPKKQLSDAISNLDNPCLIYIKIEDFVILDEFYNDNIIEKFQMEVATILENTIREYFIFDKIYQLGDGEYAMVKERLKCIENEETFIAHLKQFQDDIKNRSIKIDDIELEIAIIISAAYSDDNILQSAKLGIKELLQKKQNFIISNDLMQKKYEYAQKNIDTISMIKKALTDSRIISFFQPIVDNKTGEIVKYESLVRLIDDQNNILTPYFFLDIAKKGKYYAQITHTVLLNSFHVLKYINTDISINLSALDIEQKTTRKQIFNLLDEYRQYSNRVVFELLEDETVKDFNTIKDFITKVKEYGVKIAIDDFGSGYSNFERLLDYQPDILKLDGSLVKNIETNQYSRSIVKTIVAFAKEQKLQTIAEYVENENIFNILKEIGVEFSQGYYFGKPKKILDDNGVNK